MSVPAAQVNKADGAQMLMEAIGPGAEKMKFAWLQALEKAIKYAATPRGRRASTIAARDVDAPEHYDALNLGDTDKRELTDLQIKKAHVRRADSFIRGIAATTRIIPWKRSRGGAAARTWIFLR